jgi:hypothetical protein
VSGFSGVITDPEEEPLPDELPPELLPEEPAPEELEEEPPELLPEELLPEELPPAGDPPGELLQPSARGTARRNEARVGAFIPAAYAPTPKSVTATPHLRSLRLAGT